VVVAGDRRPRDRLADRAADHPPCRHRPSEWARSARRRLAGDGDRQRLRRHGGHGRRRRCRSGRSFRRRLGDLGDGRRARRCARHRRSRQPRACRLPHPPRRHAADGAYTAQHHAATSTLANATQTSAKLPQPASGELFHAAAAAVTDSLHFIAATAAVITLLLALLAGLVLRQRRPRPPDRDCPGPLGRLRPSTFSSAASGAGHLQDFGVLAALGDPREGPGGVLKYEEEVDRGSSPRTGSRARHSRPTVGLSRGLWLERFHHPFTRRRHDGRGERCAFRATSDLDLEHGVISRELLASAEKGYGTWPNWSVPRWEL